MHTASVGGMGASASVQDHGRPWWGSARAGKDALEGGKWRDLLEEHKADVNAVDPHTGRTLLHEVLQPGCREVPAAVEAVKFLVGCGAASVADSEGRTPVWYALQHRDGDTRSALLAALGEQVGKMQTEVANRLRHFLTDEWPALRARVAAAPAPARTAADAQQQSQEPAQNDLSMHKPADKDKTSERLQNHVDGRKVCFTRNHAACETPLLEWLVQLLGVQPDLGYREKHVNSMLLGLRFVVQRVLRGVEAAPDEIEDWMAVGDWFEHLCAGYLYTTDCVEYDMNSETFDLVCDTDGAPIVKEFHKNFTEAAVLGNHGANYVKSALYFGMNQAMRTIGLSKEVRQSAARSVFDLRPAPAQLHVIATFQPLIAKLTRLIRSRRPSLTTVFRGINVNVSAQYKVGTSVVWNAFTSTTEEQGVAKDFMYGSAGTFFVIVAKQGAAEVGFASVFPQEAELLYDSNIEFRVQWKLSPTLLRMVGQPFDVIVMQEVAGHDSNHDEASTAPLPQPQSESQETTPQADPQSRHTSAGTTHSVSDQVEAVRKVLQHTALLFAEFLEGYVEGRVGDDTHVPEAETRMLLHEVDEWLAADGDAEARETGRHPLCLVGDGGTGKTSAAVAVLCHLLQEKKAGGVASQRRKPVFPVFVALPAIGVDTVTTHAGIDEFIRKSFGLDEAALGHLSREYDVVVILDSLDEVGLTQKALSGAYKASGGQGLLQLHPWCAKQCSVIVTTRGEFLKSVGHTPSQVCGNGTRSLYMQPFTKADAVTYIGKVRAAQVAKAEQQRVDACFTADQQRQLAATVREASGTADTTVPRSDRALVVVIVERAWVLAGGDSASSSDSMGEATDAAAADQLAQGEDETAVEGASAGNGVQRENGNTCVQAAADAVMLALESRGKGTPHAGASVALRDVLVALSQHAGFLERKAAHLPADKITSPLEHLPAVPPRTVTDAEVTVLSQLRNPFLLHMACYAQRELSSFGAQAQQCLSDVAVYEAYLQKYVEVELRQGSAGAARVEEVLRVGELIACAMLQAQTWQGVLGTERARLLKEDNVGVAQADEAFRLLPFRVESFEDDSSAFTFRHKTLGEFLVARRLARKGGVPGTLGSKLRRAFSQDAPNVPQYFADLVLARGGDARDTKVATELLPLVLATRDAGGDAVSLPAASNAMSLAVRTGYVFGSEVAGVLVQDSDLRHARLCGTVLTGSRFHNCWLENALFTDVHLTRSDWAGSSFGAPLPPLLGHTSYVNSVAVTPDGSTIISGSSDNTVRVWAASTGEELQKLEGHTSYVYSVAVTPDGSKIISGSYDNSVRVWDTSTSIVSQTLQGHTESVNAVAVTPDGSKVVSGSADKSIRVWATSTGEQLHSLEGHTEPVKAVAVTPDGSKVVTGSDDMTVRIWDTSTGAELQKLEGHTSYVTTVAVSPDGSKIISGSFDNTLRVWDVSTGKVVHMLEGHAFDVNTAAVTPDGSRIISGSCDHTVRVWDASTGKELRKLEGHTADVNAVAVTPDGSRIISGSRDKTVRVWDAATGKELQLLEGHTSSVNASSISPDGSKLISVSEKSVRVWDTSTGKVLQLLEGHTESVNTVTVTPDGCRLISGSDDHSVRVWDTSTGNVLLTLEGHTESVNTVAVMPDGSKVISGSADKSVRVWDASTGKELQKLKGHTSSVNTVAVTPDGSRLISGSRDNTVRVWDALTGEQLRKLAGHTYFVNTVAVTPDGSKIISGAGDTIVRVWDISTGEQLRKLAGHTAEVNSVAVTPDGSRLISGSRDKSVRVWDVSTGEELQKLEGHSESVNTVSVTPDGSKIISGSDDKSFRVWEASTGEVHKADGNTTRSCAASWRLGAVIGSGPVVPVPVLCEGLGTVTPPHVCRLLGGALTPP